MLPLLPDCLHILSFVPGYLCLLPFFARLPVYASPLYQFACIYASPLTSFLAHAFSLTSLSVHPHTNN